jgi:hypothetical protein
MSSMNRNRWSDGVRALFVAVRVGAKNKSRPRNISLTCCYFSGAAGNRTRVLRHSLKASPCAVRYVSARISWSRELARMTIPVAVGVPMSPATELIG